MARRRAHRRGRPAVCCDRRWRRLPAPRRHHHDRAARRRGSYRVRATFDPWDSVTRVWFVSSSTASTNRAVAADARCTWTQRSPRCANAGADRAPKEQGVTDPASVRQSSTSSAARQNRGTGWDCRSAHPAVPPAGTRRIAGTTPRERRCVLPLPAPEGPPAVLRTGEGALQCRSEPVGTNSSDQKAAWRCLARGRSGKANENEGCSVPDATSVGPTTWMQESLVAAAELFCATGTGTL